ncbi:MAG TPA: cyanophycin synthetase, partial [Vicinamibacterales bacterium]|nr:cyanophycin synthetase [Vicinamibacterales bacterium]
MDPIAWLFSLEHLGIKLGLANIRRLVAALGHPERAFRSLIIAGTNGKGSVTAMIDAALRAAGRRTARYTSPHLSRLEERFVIDGRPVDAAALADAADTVRAVTERLLAAGRLAAPPTFFEATTATAFELFRRARVETAVLEVGLGGRLDATNVAPADVAAIVSIDYDHQEQLGDDLASIAREKAGVVKRRRPVVVGELPPEAMAVVVRIARAREAPLVRALEGVRLESELIDGAAVLDLETPRHRYPPLRLALRGRHQIGNAVVAVRALEAWGEVAPAAVAAGLASVEWPGRLEWIALGGGRRVLLDGAHNPGGIAALAAYLAEFHPRPLPIVFGVMRDKPAARMLAALAPHASCWWLTQPPTPRAADAA